MEAEKDLLMGVLTKTLNKTDEEISELLYQKAEDSEEMILVDGAINLVLDADKSRVSQIKKSAKPDDKALNDQYLKGKKEGKTELEAEIKTLTGLETNAIGADLVKEAVNHLSDCNVPTDEQIKAHPLYVSLEKDRVPKGDYDTAVQELKDFKLNHDKNQTFTRIDSDALTLLAGFNPVISENPAVAQTRQRDFLSKFRGYDFETAEDGDHFVKKNGTRIEDAHGNPVKFADFVKGLASLSYDFNASADLGNSGNNNDGNSSHVSVGVPKDEKEYHAQLAELWKITDSNERTKKTTELSKAWEESQKN